MKGGLNNAMPCGSAVGRILRDGRGSVLMESLLVLPLLLMLIGGIFQFARFWEAKLLTRYAAYNAARAALVYNPLHYRIPADDGGPNAGQFKSNEGVCWMAAVTTLSWLSSTTEAANYEMPGYGQVPNSSLIARQVHIVPEGCKEGDGWVKVTVQFQFPTLFSVFDATLMHPERDVAEERGIDAIRDTAKNPWFTFTETCVMPKPWTTERFPHMIPDEFGVLAEGTGGAS